MQVPNIKININIFRNNNFFRTNNIMIDSVILTLEDKHSKLNNDLINFIN